MTANSLGMRSSGAHHCQRRVLPRALPFFLYIAFLALESVVGKGPFASLAFDSRLIYPCKVACVALLLIFFWRCYDELADFKLRRLEVLWSVVVGALVFLLWVNLDHGWASFGHAAGYDPRHQSGDIDWSLAVPRMIGAAVVVPVMEELFWRSFVMRWIAHLKFIDVSPGQVGLRALLISSVLFGLEHTLWLAGIVAGFAYGALYMKSKNLWAPILAHATTNGMLGLWVLHAGQWSLW